MSGYPELIQSTSVLLELLLTHRRLRNKMFSDFVKKMYFIIPYSLNPLEIFFIFLLVIKILYFRFL